jgi:outer membrane protein assembly factor BamB
MAQLSAHAVPLSAAALVSESQVNRLGLTRAWFAQAGSLQSTGPVNHIHYSDGVLLAQTTGGMVSAIDAETGRTLWSRQVGPRGRWTSEAAANKQYVAVVNGSRLHVMDRKSGAELWNRQLRGVPGAGPGLSETYAFVPMIDGSIEGYALDGSTKFSPWTYKSAGDVMISPMATPQTVSWTTERGYFYVADPNGAGVRYRLETHDSITAQPGYWTPNLYAGSANGFVYAVDEANAQINWKYSIGDAIEAPPVAIGDKVFVISRYRGMTCLDAKAGRELWVAPGIAQFLSASGSRLYVVDASRQLVAIDIATGMRLGSTPLVDVSVTLTNPDSDRIYLVGATGAVQCLHEMRQRTPVLHVPPAPAIKEKPKVKDRSKAPAEEEAAEDTPAEEMPADETPAEAPAEPSDSPFGAEEAPATPPAAVEDDPFATP